MDIQQGAKLLRVAEMNKQPIAPFTSSTEISVDDAYRIQLLQIQDKIEAGAEVVGMKIGLTSKVMQDMFKVTTPDFGHILNTMVYDEKKPIKVQQFIQPKVEFELAFFLKTDLQGPNVSEQDVMAATEYIAPAIEIIDSRIENWQFQFQDTVADNGSSAGTVIGQMRTAVDLRELETIELVANRNGEVFDRGLSNAVMGNPARAVAWLANMLSDYDISLKAGQFILAGAITAAVPFEAGDTFEANFGSYGTVRVVFS